ncbi:unnamed protein product [Closterium sp. NIES-65]|nr:unnamed protein product [Closterium sp. NIES-65]
MKAFELLGLGAQDTVQYARVGEHPAMRAFELLGLSGQESVQYARVGEVGGDGAGDNDHDLDPHDHDSHNHAGSGARGSPQLGASARGSPPPRKQQQQRVPGVVFKTEAARAAAAALDEEMAGGGEGGGGGGSGGGGGGSGVGEVRRPRQTAAAPWCSVSEGVRGPCLSPHPPPPSPSSSLTRKPPTCLWLLKATCLWVLVSLALSITLTQLLMGMCGYNLRFKGAWVTLVYDPSTRAQTTESVASLEHSVYDNTGVFQVTFDTLEEEIREIRDQLNGNQKTGAKPAAPVPPVVQLAKLRVQVEELSSQHALLRGKLDSLVAAAGGVSAGAEGSAAAAAAAAAAVAAAEGSAAAGVNSTGGVAVQQAVGKLLEPLKARVQRDEERLKRVQERVDVVEKELADSTEVLQQLQVEVVTGGKGEPAAVVVPSPNEPAAVVIPEPADPAAVVVPVPSDAPGPDAPAVAGAMGGTVGGKEGEAEGEEEEGKDDADLGPPEDYPGEGDVGEEGEEGGEEEGEEEEGGEGEAGTGEQVGKKSAGTAGETEARGEEEAGEGEREVGEEGEEEGGEVGEEGEEDESRAVGGIDVAEVQQCGDETLELPPEAKAWKQRSLVQITPDLQLFSAYRYNPHTIAMVGLLSPDVPTLPLDDCLFRQLDGSQPIAGSLLRLQVEQCSFEAPRAALGQQCSGLEATAATPRFPRASLLPPSLLFPLPTFPPRCFTPSLPPSFPPLSLDPPLEHLGSEHPGMVLRFEGGTVLPPCGGYLECTAAAQHSPFPSPTSPPSPVPPFPIAPSEHCGSEQAAYSLLCSPIVPLFPPFHSSSPFLHPAPLPLTIYSLPPFLPFFPPDFFLSPQLSTPPSPLPTPLTICSLLITNGVSLSFPALHPFHFIPLFPPFPTALHSPLAPPHSPHHLLAPHNKRRFAAPLARVAGLPPGGGGGGEVCPVPAQQEPLAYRAATGSGGIRADGDGGGDRYCGDRQGAGKVPRPTGLSLPHLSLLYLDPPSRPRRVSLRLAPRHPPLYSFFRIFCPSFHPSPRQFLALQDCLYRTSLSSTWTLPLDLDEYLSASPPATLPFIHSSPFSVPPFTPPHAIPRPTGLSLPHLSLLYLDPPSRPRRVSLRLAPCHPPLYSFFPIFCPSFHPSPRQFLALQDCLYRTSLSSTWTLPLDLDEYLSASPPATLPSLLSASSPSSLAASPYLSLGAVRWSTEVCLGEADVVKVEREGIGGEGGEEDEADAAGDGGGRGNSSSTGAVFAVERAVFREPAPVCNADAAGEAAVGAAGGGGGEVDAALCEGDAGTRRVIVNPRKVRMGVGCGVKEGALLGGPMRFLCPSSPSTAAHPQGRHPSQRQANTQAQVNRVSLLALHHPIPPKGGATLDARTQARVNRFLGLSSLKQAGGVALLSLHHPISSKGGATLNAHTQARVNRFLGLSSVKQAGGWGGCAAARCIRGVALLSLHHPISSKGGATLNAHTQARVNRFLGLSSLKQAGRLCSSAVQQTGDAAAAAVDAAASGAPRGSVESLEVAEGARLARECPIEKTRECAVSLTP